MAPVVKVRDIVEEMEILNDQLHAYLNKQTGELITLSSDVLEAAEDEDDLESYADWQQEDIRTAQKILNTDDYLPLPSNFDIDKYSIMEQFCHEIENDELSDELLSQIRGSGAFRRFKNAVNRHGIAEDWYRYRQSALEKIAIDWLEAHEIPYEIN
jgi:hypothetical protein